MPAEPSDIQQIKALIVEGLTERWGNYDSRLNPDVESFASHYGGDVVLVIKEGDSVVGVGVLHNVKNSRAEIVRMSVRADRRRSRIGSRILAALLSEAKARGIDSVHLETTASWNSAVRFYERHGFVRTHVDGGDQHFSCALADV